MPNDAPDVPTVTVVVMGVSGVGKSHVAAALAASTGWPLLEGDSLHSERNRARMSAGLPLTDADRAPWLAAVANWIGEREAAGENAVLTCSALRRRYRDTLRSGHPSVWFAHLTAPAEVLESRLRARTGHFMPASLLASQLATLEPLQPDEPGAVIGVAGDPDRLAAEIRRRLAEVREGAE
jgi:gluconokinase